MTLSSDLNTAVKPTKISQKSDLFDLGLVNAELTASMEKLANVGKAVSIFGSARLSESHPACQMAFSLGEALSAQGVSIITCGCPHHTPALREEGERRNPVTATC